MQSSYQTRGLIAFNSINPRELNLCQYRPKIPQTKAESGKTVETWSASNRIWHLPLRQGEVSVRDRAMAERLLCKGYWKMSAEERAMAVMTGGHVYPGINMSLDGPRQPHILHNLEI